MRKDEIVLQGVTVSSGIAIGSPSFLSTREEGLSKLKLKKSEVSCEIERYRGAIEKSKRDLQHLQKRFAKEGLAVVVAILEGHLEILHDPVMTELVEGRIRRSRANVESAVNQVVDEYKKRFSNEFFKERIKDVRDVSVRVLKHLKPLNNEGLRISKKNAVLIARDLVPSDAFEAKLQNVLAFVTEKGGYSSHAGIIARANGIPYVTKVDVDRISGEEIDNIIIDGIDGIVIVNPRSDTLKKYKNLQKKFASYQPEIADSCLLPTKTKDNKRVKLFANIDAVEDIKLAEKNHSDGIGLFRTEYIFLRERRFPSQEEQYEIYREVIRGGNVIIRLFDIGGEKNHLFTEEERKRFDIRSGYFEMNPDLGCRAIRFLIKNRKLLDDQLRAILRASEEGAVSILIPFVSDIYEIRYVKKRIEEIKEDFRDRKIRFSDQIFLGFMVEIPSAALMGETYMREVDFCSIGTNDLFQYTMAADRSNPDTGYLCDHIHPSFLRIVEMIVKASKKAGKPLTICGELVADPRFTEFFLGLGIERFSMSPRNIPIIRNTIRKLDTKRAEKRAKEALSMLSFEELDRFITSD